MQIRVDAWLNQVLLCTGPLLWSRVLKRCELLWITGISLLFKILIVPAAKFARRNQTNKMPFTSNIGRFEFCGFAVHVIRGRWFMVFAAFLIMAAAGATYLFGNYSPVIKSTQGYDQTTLNLVGFFKDLGGYVGLHSGLIAEVTPQWFGLLLGSAMNFAGFFMIWLAVSHRIAKPKVWQMCLYICIGANSQNFAHTGALVPCVMNFPESRGALLGLLKGYVGLSGAILTQIYLAVYGNDYESLILLIAWLPAAISLVFMCTFRTMKVPRQPNELKVFYQFLFASTALALFVMVMIIVQQHVVFSHAAYVGSATMICFLLLLPLLIAIREEYFLWNLKKITENPTMNEVTIVESERVESSPRLLEEKKAEKRGASCLANIFNKPERGEDYTILQALLSIDMFILLYASFSGLGASLSAVDNLGQIGQSLGYEPNTVRSFVSLVSIWNYFGRVFTGFVSEIWLQKYKVPRPLMMSLVLLVSCIGHLLIAFPFSGSVYVASVIVGFTLGAQFPLFYAIVSELFGLKHFASLFNAGQLASPLGTYVLNVKVTGFLYDQKAKEQLKRSGKELMKDKELTCFGRECYRLAFIILASISFSGALLLLILVMRTREFYKGDIYKKFREEAITAETELAPSSVQESEK